MGEARRLAAESSPCEADDVSGMLGRVGNYLGSWVGLGRVSEHEGNTSLWCALHDPLPVISTVMQAWFLGAGWCAEQVI